MATPFEQTLRSMRIDGYGRSLLSIGVLLAFLASWTGWFCFARVAVHKVSVEARLEFVQRVHSVSAARPGRVVALPVRLGDEISAGTILAALDSGDLPQRIREAAARVGALHDQRVALQNQVDAGESALQEFLESVGSKLAEAEARLATLDIEERAARADLERQEQLGALVAEEALAHARSRVELAQGAAVIQRRTSDRQQGELRVQEKDRREELAELRVELARIQGQRQVAEASAQTLDEELERYLLRAEVAGTVGELAPLSIGAFLEAGQHIASITQPGPVHVYATFQASQAIGHVEQGQAARIRLDGFAWTQYGSLGARVLRVGTETRAGLVQVELGVDEPASSSVPLEHGLTGTVEVEVERTTPAALVLRAVGKSLGSGDES